MWMTPKSATSQQIPLYYREKKTVQAEGTQRLHLGSSKLCYTSLSSILSMILIRRDPSKLLVRSWSPSLRKQHLCKMRSRTFTFLVYEMSFVENSYHLWSTNATGVPLHEAWQLIDGDNQIGLRVPKPLHKSTSLLAMVRRDVVCIVQPSTSLRPLEA